MDWKEIKLLFKRMIANYKKLPSWERMFDTFLLASVIFGAIIAILTSFIQLSPNTINILHGIDIAIFFVFVLDLIFAYSRINHLPTFVKHSWLDATVLLIGFIATSYMVYAGITRINYLLKVTNIHKIASFYHLGAISKKFI